MLTFGKTLWITLILLTDFLLPLGCTALTETKKILEDIGNQDSFSLKPARRLLDWRDTQNSSSRTATIVSIIICAIVAAIFLLVRCCIRLASQQDEDQVVTVHRPPSNLYTPSTLFSEDSRPFRTPSMTPSRQITILPEPQVIQSYFIGIENPTFIPPSRTNDMDQDRRNLESLTDLPPAYEAVVKADSQNMKSGNSTNLPPPYM